MAFINNKPEQVTHASLQLEEDMPFFTKEVVFQRVGWVLIAITLLLGCLGLFGTGMLSIKKQHVAGITFEYEKYLRFENETELIFRLPASASGTDISFPLPYHEQFRVEKTMPEAQLVTSANGNMTYRFATGGNSEIRIFITPTNTGSIDGTVRVGSTPFSFSQFVYP